MTSAQAKSAFGNPPGEDPTIIPSRGWFIVCTVWYTGTQLISSTEYNTLTTPLAGSRSTRITRLFVAFSLIRLTTDPAAPTSCEQETMFPLA